VEADCFHSEPLQRLILRVTEIVTNINHYLILRSLKRELFQRLQPRNESLGLAAKCFDYNWELPFWNSGSGHYHSDWGYTPVSFRCCRLVTVCYYDEDSNSFLTLLSDWSDLTIESTPPVSI
jgi:hypothetical protein